MKVFLIAVMLLVCCGTAAAQTLFDCACPSGSTTATSTVVICWNGTNYNVNVTYCYRQYSPPALLICHPTLNQDYAIVIQKICPPVGAAIPLNALIRGTVQAFDVCCGNLLNTSLTAITPLWCYTFAIPQCWQMVANCWEPCPDSDCCLAAYQWEYVSPLIPCRRTITRVCAPEVECATGCTEWDCTFPVDCSCQ